MKRPVAGYRPGDMRRRSSRHANVVAPAAAKPSTFMTDFEQILADLQRGYDSWQNCVARTDDLFRDQQANDVRLREPPSRRDDDEVGDWERDLEKRSKELERFRDAPLPLPSWNLPGPHRNCQFFNLGQQAFKLLVDLRRKLASIGGRHVAQREVAKPSAGDQRRVRVGDDVASEGEDQPAIGGVPGLQVSNDSGQAPDGQFLFWGIKGHGSGSFSFGVVAGEEPDSRGGVQTPPRDATFWQSWSQFRLPLLFPGDSILLCSWGYETLERPADEDWWSFNFLDAGAPA